MRLALLSLLLLANCAAPAASRPSARIDAERRTEEEERQQTRADLEELLARAKAKARQQPPATAPTPAAPLTPPATAPTPVLTDPFDDQLPPGSIAADVIARFHAAGPQALLRALETEPARAEGKVLGYRVVSIAPGAAFLRRAQILPGDIILRVNGTSIITPDGFMKVWTDLPKATAIDLSLLRGTESINRHWDVIPSPAPSAP